MRDFLERAESDLPATVVVADMGAGLEHLSWAGGTVRHVDLLLVVVESNRKTMLTGARTDRLARQLGVSRVALIANRVGNGADEAQLRTFAGDLGREMLAVVPEDGAVIEADRWGRCVLDLAPGAPAVHAIEGLAVTVEDLLIGSAPVSTGPG